MADDNNNGQIPPEEPQEPNQDPGKEQFKAAEGFVRDIVQQEIAPLAGQINQLTGAVNNITRLLEQSAAAQTAAANESGGSVTDAPQEPVSALTDPASAITAAILGLLTNPVQLLNTFAAFKAATRPDDFATAKEIALRQPYAIIAANPMQDPYGGKFPDIQQHSFKVGMDVLASAVKPLLVKRLSSEGLDGIYGTPGVPSPGPTATPMSPPGSTTPTSGTGTGSTPTSQEPSDPSLTHVSQGNRNIRGGTTLAFSSDSYNDIDDQVLDFLLADVMRERVRRDKRQQKVRVNG